MFDRSFTVELPHVPLRAPLGGGVIPSGRKPSESLGPLPEAIVRLAEERAQELREERAARQARAENDARIRRSIGLTG